MKIQGGFKVFGAVCALSVVSSIASEAAAFRSCEADQLRAELVRAVKNCRSNLLTLKIGYNPGGNTYALGSHFMAYIKSITGDSEFNVILESRAGASGEIASRLVADLDSSAAACNVLVAQSNQLTTNMMGFPNAIDPLRDLIPIVPLGEAPLVLAVNPQTAPYKTLEEFVRYMKLYRGAGRKDFFGSNGNYATDHVATEMMLQKMGTVGTHVPFTGSAPFIQNLLATTDGQVNFGLLSLGLIKSHLVDGKLIGLGVASPSALRLSRPDGTEVYIPSISELVPEFKEASIWVALAGGRNMPDSLGDVMEHTATCFARDAQVRKVLVDQMAFSLGGTRAQMLRRMSIETEAAKSVPKK